MPKSNTLSLPAQDTGYFPGDLLRDKYELLRPIGEGGMGAVYKAEHSSSGQLAALKLPARKLLAQPAALQRFLREVQAVRALSHPNIVAAYEAGQVGDNYFLAMEYVEGRDLSTWVEEFGRLPVAQKGDQPGRDHNPHAFTTWFAGGGVKGGTHHGATDETGLRAEENRVSIHDLHATLLHLLGLDHERLTFRYNGRDFRLTDVEGTVVDQILS